MTDDLMNIWKFDEADLGANRLGKLTEKQKTFLAGEHKSQRGVFLGVGGAIVALFCCLPILLVGGRVILPMALNGDLSDLQEILPIGAMGAFGVVFMAIALLAVGAAVAIYILRANKKADTTVKRVEGQVKYTWGTKRVRTPGSSVRGYEDVRVLHLNLADKKFEVKEQLQAVIQEGEEWIIYYTSVPFKFLSGEKLTK